MAVNLYDHANQLEQALRESDEYQAIQMLMQKLKKIKNQKIYLMNSVKHIKFPTKTNAR